MSYQSILEGGKMNFLLFFTILFLLGFTLITVYTQNKIKTLKLSYHPMQAKRILNSSDLKDNRNWFISRFIEAQDFMAKSQASVIQKFDHKSIINLREKLNNSDRDNSLSN